MEVDKLFYHKINFAIRDYILQEGVISGVKDILGIIRAVLIEEEQATKKVTILSRKEA
jgi:hypothetical protein